MQIWRIGLDHFLRNLLLSGCAAFGCSFCRRGVLAGLPFFRSFCTLGAVSFCGLSLRTLRLGSLPLRSLRLALLSLVGDDMDRLAVLSRLVFCLSRRAVLSYVITWAVRKGCEAAS